ncbi:spastin [Paramyrothecium foliicola]|nr:spastin [Paramyrothecium foliicola]
MTSLSYSNVGGQLPDTASLNDSSQERPFHSKRPHKKSRTGCKNCKARKVKCDEARPTCRSCRLRKAECVYPHAVPAAVTGNGLATPPTTDDSLPISFTASTPAPWETALSPWPPSPFELPSSSTSLAFQDQDEIYEDGTNDSLVIAEPMFRPSGIDATDMKLLWFYTSTTAASFSVVEDAPGRSTEEIMKNTLVQMGFENPFLMDSLFALASLHMRSTKQNLDVSRTAYYRARAIQGYRRAVEEAKPETFPALLANSLILTALSSETFREPDTKDLFILDWITIWRGIGLMIGLNTVRGMYKSGLQPLFNRPALDLEAGAAAIPNKLLLMISSIPIDDPDYLNIDTYYRTLRYLGTLYQNLRLDIGYLMHLRVITWFTFVPADFVELTRVKQPRALVIIAHYACFLKMMFRVWWMVGIGQRTLQDICKYLSDEWHPYLSVPLQAIGIEDETMLGRLILNEPLWVPTESDDLNSASAGPGEKKLGWVSEDGKMLDPKLAETGYKPEENEDILVSRVTLHRVGTVDASPRMNASGFRAIPAGCSAARVSSFPRRSIHSTGARFVAPGNGAPKPAEDSLTEQNDQDEDPDSHSNAQLTGGRQKNHATPSQKARLAKQRTGAALPPVQLSQRFLEKNVAIYDPLIQPQIPYALAVDAKSEKIVHPTAVEVKPNERRATPKLKLLVERYFSAALSNLFYREKRFAEKFDWSAADELSRLSEKRADIQRAVRRGDMIIDSARHIVDSYAGQHNIYSYKTRPFWWWHFNRDLDPQTATFRERYSPLQIYLDIALEQAEQVDCPLAHTVADLPDDTYTPIRDIVIREFSVRAPPNFDPKTSQRPITILSLSGYGGNAIAESLASQIAYHARANVVHLNASDLAVLVGQYTGQDWAYSRGPLSMLGFRAAEINGKLKSDPDQASRTNEEDDDEMESNLISVRSITNSLEEDLQKKAKQRGYEVFTKWEQLKIDKILDCLIRSPKLKDPSDQPRRTLIHIHDIVELSLTLEGSMLISRLRALVDAAWHQGSPITLFGTSSTEQPSDEYQDALREIGIRDLVISRHIQPQRTSQFMPSKPQKTSRPFDLQRIDYIEENVENIKRMIQAIDPDFAEEYSIHNIPSELFYPSSALNKTPNILEDAILPPSEVYTAAVSFISNERIYRGDGSRMSLLSFYNLGSLRQKEGEGTLLTDQLSGTQESPEHARGRKDTEPERITVKPNEYEKRIASGQINTNDIRVTFADVHAPQETISALKLLTSLALVRPDAFSYGVLASDKIPGCLLYGPPGTGKTMLAKAVAKESGANMLEISGATINDKWVGESEKLIKAVFTLAKRLSPCVVFIDEADSLFANRSMYSNRASHREHINQFLREWDGMQETNAFIMVATNRPFDLDDAVLRRLPRKILVDLPMKEDRLAILKLLMRGEQLNGTVSLEDLAERTPFYSGSDLKNVCVAAAMAAVEEENEAAARHTGPEPYVYPERRVLRKDHFEKALQQIPASISEDMASLKQIRKFDEEYGNRKRKSKKSMGFGIVDEKKLVDVTDARIRP